MNYFFNGNLLHGAPLDDILLLKFMVYSEKRKVGHRNRSLRNVATWIRRQFACQFAVCRWSTNLVAQHAVIRSQQERLCSQHSALTMVTISTMSRDNVFGAVTILLARFPRNSASNASRSNRFFFSLQRPASSTSYSVTSGHGFSGGKVPCLVPRLRISGEIPSILNMKSWCPQEQL